MKIWNAVCYLFQSSTLCSQSENPAGKVRVKWQTPFVSGASFLGIIDTIPEQCHIVLYLRFLERLTMLMKYLSTLNLQPTLHILTPFPKTIYPLVYHE